MAENDKKYGRTFFDLIAEYPKPTFFIFLTILLIAIALIILKIPFKVGNVEVGENQSVLHDPIVKTKIDTQDLNKTPIVIKKIQKIKPTKKTNNNISVKTNDTIVTVQSQSANINTGVNNGIIGNNNEVNVNVNEIPRRLDSPSKQRLIQLINATFEQNKNIVDSTIWVSALAGNHEAFNLASEILQFLKEENFRVENFIGQFQQSPPIKGVQIGVGFVTKHVEIRIGYK